MRQEGHGKIQRVSHLNPTNGHGGTVEPGIASPPGSRGHKVELQGKSMPAKGLGPSQKVKGKGAAKKNMKMIDILGILGILPPENPVLTSPISPAGSPKRAKH